MKPPTSFITSRLEGNLLDGLKLRMAGMAFGHIVWLRIKVAERSYHLLDLGRNQYATACIWLMFCKLHMTSSCQCQLGVLPSFAHVEPMELPCEPLEPSRIMTAKGHDFHLGFTKTAAICTIPKSSPSSVGVHQSLGSLSTQCGTICSSDSSYLVPANLKQLLTYILYIYIYMTQNDFLGLSKNNVYPKIW